MTNARMKSVRNTGKGSSGPADSAPQGSQPKAGWRRTASANRVIIIGSGNSGSRLMDR